MTRIHQFSPVGVHLSDAEVLRRGNAQQSASSVLHCISWDARSVIFIYYPEKRKSDNKILYCAIMSFEQMNEKENVKYGEEKNVSQRKHLGTHIHKWDGKIEWIELLFHPFVFPSSAP